MSRILSVCLNPTFQRTVSLPRLDTGEVNRADDARLDASGKGVNVSRVLTQLGSEAVHLTHLGPGREDFLDRCRDDGVEVEWVESDSPIRTCITLLDGEAHSTTEVIEPTVPVNGSTVEGVRSAYSRLVAESGWVVLSGSKAPGYPADLFADFCAEAAGTGARVIADYRGGELVASLPHRPAVVKVNLVEFCLTFLPDLQVSEADDAAALPAVEKKAAEMSGDGMDLVITRGAREVICAHMGSISKVTPESIVPVNTIGSGDATAAGMAHALAGGADLTSAVAEGVRCGGQNALRLKPGSLK